MRPYTIEWFEGEGKQPWYFGGVARNGKITFQSEGYSREQDAKRAAHNLVDQIRSGEVVIKKATSRGKQRTRRKGGGSRVSSSGRRSQT